MSSHHTKDELGHSPSKESGKLSEKNIEEHRTNSVVSSVSSDSIHSIASEEIGVEAYDGFSQPIKVSSRTVVQSELSRHVTGVSVATNFTTDPGFEVDFEDDDTGDPKQFPLWKRGLIIFLVSYSTLVV